MNKAASTEFGAERVIYGTLFLFFRNYAHKDILKIESLLQSQKLCAHTNRKISFYNINDEETEEMR